MRIARLCIEGPDGSPARLAAGADPPGALSIDVRTTHRLSGELASHRERNSSGSMLWSIGEIGEFVAARVYVAKSDEQAEAEAREYKLGDVLGPLVPPPEQQAGNPKILGAVFGPSGFSPPGPESMPEYHGSPQTVARQMSEQVESIGYDVSDLTFTADRLPHEKAVRSLELFGREVAPRLRGL